MRVIRVLRRARHANDGRDRVWCPGKARHHRRHLRSLRSSRPAVATHARSRTPIFIKQFVTSMTNIFTKREPEKRSSGLFADGPVKYQNVCSVLRLYLSSRIRINLINGGATRETGPVPDFYTLRSTHYGTRSKSH